MSGEHCERDGSADIGGPAVEVDITPEMIEVGAAILVSRWLDLTRPSSEELFAEVAVEMYRAMHLSH